MNAAIQPWTAVDEALVGGWGGAAPSESDSHLPLDLDGFLTLPENHSAVQAMTALVAEVILGEPASTCPLVLHGRPGTGKTELTTAVLRALATGAASTTARSVPVRELARPDSIETDSGFADPDLATCDLLVLEDVQHLPAASADALCELIDQRAARQLALVVTSSVGPAGLTHLPRRLTSRLTAGLVVQLEQPGAASRRAILAAASRIALAPDALEWLAEQRGGLRAALGQLQNLSAHARNYPTTLDRRAVKQILQGTGQPTSSGTDLNAIVQRVCAAFDVTSTQLLGTSRLRNAVLPRQVAMYLARENGQLSFAQIGIAFSRDHSTVLHACRKIESARKTDAEFAAVLRQLKKELT